MGALYSKSAETSSDNNNDNGTSSTTTTAARHATINEPEQRQQSQEAVRDEQEKKMSKNQLKRKRKWENAMEIKRRRKEQERNIRHAQAKADGRDIEAERKIQEENRKTGIGWAKRNTKWKESFEENSSNYGICLDCSFEDVMMKQEINSLSSQIRYCYAANKRAKHPVHAKATSIGGSTLERLEKVSGFDSWKNRAFDCTPQDLVEAYGNDKSKLVYLTSDSENTLEELEDGKVYIIGGIVDRNRLQRAAINRAEELGIATARLPISDYLNMVSTKVLTCNHVFEILLKYRDNDGNWKGAFLDVLPSRKDAKEKGSK